MESRASVIMVCYTDIMMLQDHPPNKNSGFLGLGELPWQTLHTHQNSLMDELSMSYATPLGEGNLWLVSSKYFPNTLFSFTDFTLYLFTIMSQNQEYNNFQVLWVLLFNYEMINIIHIKNILVIWFILTINNYSINKWEAELY